MSETIQLPLERRTTAIGRFFMTADHQQHQSGQEGTASVDVPQKPTDEAIALAEEELRTIFSGDNAEESQRIYDKGHSDIVSQRPKTLEALSYAYVQQLIDIANHRIDVLRT
jgi:hypothetical protein